MLNWANRFSTFCFLDNHQYQLAPHTEECLLAAGVKREYKAMAGGALDGLQEMINASPSWLFGHLGYDLQLETAGISSSCPDRIGFPDCFFFEPVYLIRLTDNQISISGPDPVAIWQEIQDEPELPAQQEKRTAIKGRYTKETYISVLEQLKKHILRGDCYEINFCQEFYSEDSLLNPISVYRDLSRISPNPFSALYRQDDHWLICASPERFLRKEGRRILSQPIKGTARRNSSNADQDLAGKEALQRSEKDRSENVMVVDLVRNDLSRVCEEGSVKVDELFGVYSFPQVHQMISTVSGQVREDLTFADLIRATFPMGSMTGAPKKRVMELIREYENSRRGIFSGALGYISPAGDFDFNVVIRSIMYNAGSGYLSFQAGSGITWYSDPEKEWEECLLKASAIEAVLR
ncbi:MAG: anthranilate synthase component I family protein [Chitinophagaceae bacterium]|nr:anthranilate synthase component I family protein [Chitinophagaceae bacterium]